MKVSTGKYAKALASSLKGEKDQAEIERKMQNLLKILMKNKQIKSIKKFQKDFKEEWYKMNDILEVTATIPYEASEDQKEELSKLLGEAFGKKVILYIKVDSEVIGGMKLEFNDSIIDATVKRNLEVLKNSLSKN